MTDRFGSATLHADDALATSQTHGARAQPQPRPGLFARFAGSAPAQPRHPRPTPRVRPETRRDDEVLPAWLERAAERRLPVAIRDRDAPRSSHGPRAAARRRRAHRRLWLAAAAFVAISTAGGGSLYFIAASGHDLPGREQLASLADGLAALLPSVPVQSAKSNPDDGYLMATGEEPAVQSASLGHKPVTTARLEVTDASGRALGPIPLALAVEPPAGDGEIVLRLTGLPAGAALNSGARQADGAWLVESAQMADLGLLLASPAPEQVTMQVEAIDKASGELAAPMKEMTVTVLGGDARLETASLAPNESAKGEAADMLSRGLEKLLSGDGAAARDLFRTSLELGEKRAIAHLARTYDPVVHERLKLRGIEADPRQALAWYLRAREAGDESAAADIATLAAWGKR